MKDKHLTNEESLAIITDMIGQAKRNIARGGGSFYFLLWGWVVASCNLAHYVLWRFDLYDEPQVVWIITIPTSIISIVYGARQSSRAQVKSHIDNLYGLIWLGVVLAAVVTLIFSATGETSNGVILIYAALGTFLSGCTLRFIPSIIGSLLLLATAIGTFYLPVMDQYLVAALGIFAGYIVPGYILRKAERERI